MQSNGEGIQAKALCIGFHIRFTIINERYIDERCLNNRERNTTCKDEAHFGERAVNEGVKQQKFQTFGAKCHHRSE